MKRWLIPAALCALAGAAHLVGPYPMPMTALVLILLGAALFWMLRGIWSRPSEPAPEPTVTETVPVLPPSQLDAACFGTENGHKTYQSKTLTAALGVDISSHQGYIDWEQVAGSDVQFAIIRAGFRGYMDGSRNDDEALLYNLSAAAEQGLDVGLYYFSQAVTPEEAREEARDLLALLDGAPLQYPIYFDWEPVADETARTSSISSTELTDCALAFCQSVEQAGYKAGIYFNLSLATHYYQLYRLRDYSFWLAEYQDTPSFPFQVDLWQYSSEGAVPGIDTQVDMNLSFTAS